MYLSIPKSPPPPRGGGANPGAFDFFEKFWSNSPLCWQFRLSNAPPVKASKRVKTPTLQGKQNRLHLEIKGIAYIWKQVVQNFQPLRISCSACPHCTELNASQMPGDCPGGWAVLELTGTLIIRVLTKRVWNNFLISLVTIWLHILT